MAKGRKAKSRKRVARGSEETTKEVKQFVLMNSETGAMGCGLRLKFFDSVNVREIESAPGYVVSLDIVDGDPDLWAIQAYEGQPWITVTPGDLRGIEVLSEL